MSKTTLADEFIVGSVKFTGYFSRETISKILAEFRGP
jgi:hypothetical protein